MNKFLLYDTSLKSFCLEKYSANEMKHHIRQSILAAKLAFTCSKTTMETSEESVKSVQSQQ